MESASSGAYTLDSHVGPTLHLQPHLNTPELGGRGRRAPPNMVEAYRWQGLILVTDVQTITEAAQWIGLYPKDARRVVLRYDDDGPIGVHDRRLIQAPSVHALLLRVEQRQGRAAAITRPDTGGACGPSSL